MNKLVKLGIGAASSAILLVTFASSTFAADLSIEGNGTKSDNSIKVDNTCTTTVTQNSNTTVGATINASSSSGGNVASGNTGGNVSVTSGDATTGVTVTVTGGSNSATTPSCCCGEVESGDTQTIATNGSESKNKIDTKSHKTVTTKQKSKTVLGLSASLKSKTGKNKAKDNTGSGVTVETGASSTVVGVEVTGGENTL